MAPPESLSHREPLPRASTAGRGGETLRVVVAPNAFKGSLSAVDAAEAMSAGIRHACPGAQVDLAPIADGGDGSVAAFVRVGFTPSPVITRGPTGERVDATVAVRDGMAVVELADACGLARLPGGQLQPLRSSTLGLGDAVRAALDTGAEDLIVCLGGSASTDGGAGLLVALGARLLDGDGREVTPAGATLASVTAIDASALDPRLARTRVVAAVDVDSPLTGPTGAAAVFAPQKGADPDQVLALDGALQHWAAVLRSTFGTSVAGRPGAGAAGGTGAALLAIGADLRPGFAVVARALDLPSRMAGADLVVTGEGRLDEQSFLGKGVGGVATLAAAAGVPVLAACGEIALDAERLRSLGIIGWQGLRELTDSDDDARSQAQSLLERATSVVVGRWRSG